MSFTQYAGASFGPNKAGLSTVGYRLYNTSGAALAARITAGVGERAPGYYAASIVFPLGFIGELRWDTGELNPIYASVFLNPIDFIASPGIGANTVTVTVLDDATPVENAVVRLTEGADSFVAMSDVDGIASFSLDPATYNIAITKPGYYFTPTTIEVTGDGNFDEALIVQPAPAADDITLCRVYGSFETIDNRPLANVEVEFTLIAPSATASERLITGRKVKVKTDALGQLLNHDGDPWIDLQRNDSLTPDDTFYRVDAPALSINNVSMTLEAESFDLTTLAT